MTLLRTQALKKHFGDTRAVDGVDFVVNEGEFLSLVGTNGAGKTTLVNLISAFLLPDGGKIFIGERDITHAPVHQRIRAG
ncbi:MAG: ATP-binding cassette domain-containing protein, partial [Burkholderiales bacterium]